MALIRCPACGHQVLSVASRCPSCSTRLTPNANSVGSLNELESCPRCEGLIVRGTKECPHCGYAAGRWRAARAVGTVALVTLAVVLFLVVVPGLERDPVTSPLPLPAGTEAMIPIPDPIPETPNALDETDTSMAGPRGTEPTPPPAQATPISTRRPPPPNVFQQWTNEWANLRTARNREAPIVRVLRPGTAIDVASPAGGWWAVYEGDSVAGYIAGNLIDSLSPDSRD